MQNVKAGKLTFCPPHIRGFVFEAEVTLPGGMGGTERREWGGNTPHSPPEKKIGCQSLY